MGLETGNYINDLVVTNPDGADSRTTADDHIRLLKKTVKQTFPNLNSAVNATPTQLNLLVGKTDVATQAQIDAAAFNSALPLQTGNAGKFVKTDGTNASWAYAGISTVSSATSATNIALTSSDVFTYRSISMTAMGKHVSLPDATALQVGGPIWILKNDGGYPFGIRDNAGTLVAAVAAGGIAYVTLKDNSTAAGSWSVIGDNLEPGLITIDSTFSSTYASTVLAPFVALDSNTSIHFAALSSGFAAFVVDNTGKALTTPVTVSSTGSSAPRAAFKVSATSAIVFYGAGSTDNNAVVLTVSGSSPSLSLAVGTPATTAANTSATTAWGLEDFTGAPKIAQLSSTLYLASYVNSTTNTSVVAISVSGTTVTIGSAVNIIAASSVAGSSTTYTLTATTALVIYSSGAAAPYAINAVVVSVSGTTCTVGTPAAAASTISANGAFPHSCLLSATKALVVTDNNTTTAVAHALTISGTAVSWGAALTVESGVTGFNTSGGSSYGGNSATRYNPHLFPLSSSTALLWYLDSSSISRAVVLSESGGTVTAGTILYRSIRSASGATSDGYGMILPQGTTEFVSLMQGAAETAGAAFQLMPCKISGTTITQGSARPVRNLKSAPAPLQYATRLSSGVYAITSTNTGIGNSVVPVFSSNGDIIALKGEIPVPAMSGSGMPGAASVSSNRLVILGSTEGGTTVGASTKQLRLLNVEIAA